MGSSRWLYSPFVTSNLYLVDLLLTDKNDGVEDEEHSEYVIADDVKEIKELFEDHLSNDDTCLPFPFNTGDGLLEL